MEESKNLNSSKTSMDEQAPLKPIYSQRYRGLKPVTSISFLAFTISAFFIVEQQYLNSYIIQVLNESAYLVAFMISCSAIVGLITQFLYGAWSDSLPNNKWGRRKPFTIGGIIAGVSMILIPFTNQFWMVWVIDVCIISLFANATLMARKAIVPDLFPLEIRGSSNAKVAIGEVIGGVFAVSFGAFVLARFPVNEQIVGDDIIYSNAEPYHFIVIISIALLAIIGNIIFYFTIQEPKIEFEPISMKNSLKEVFQLKEMTKHKEFLKFWLIFLVMQIAYYIFTPYSVVFISIGASGNPIYASALSISILIGLVGGFLLFGYLLNKYPRKPITIASVMISGIGFLFVSLFGATQDQAIGRIILVVISFSLANIGATGWNIAQTTWSQDLLPERQKAKFLGILNIAVSGAQIPGNVIGAFIFEEWGVQWVFFFAAVIFLLFGWLYVVIKETYHS